MLFFVLLSHGQMFSARSLLLATEKRAKNCVQKLFRRNNCDIQLINHNYFHPLLDGSPVRERNKAQISISVFAETAPNVSRKTRKKFSVVVKALKPLKADLHKQANYGLIKL